MSRRRLASGNSAWLDMDDADIRAMIAEIRPDVDNVLAGLADRVAARAMQSTAFSDTERRGVTHLRPSIRVRKSRYEDGGYIVQARAPHAHLVEFGHAQVTHDGRVVGHVPAHSFLRAARDEVLASLGDLI